MKLNIAKINQKIEDITVNVPVSANRIVAFDIIRGLFMLIILIDHIELYPSGFDYLTGRGRLFVSAAEGFFFMSGLLVGMIYKRRIGLGMKFIFKKMWTRGFELYLASVFFTLLFTAAAVFSNHQNIKDGLYGVINWPHIIKETLLMRYGYGWTDFLDRFAILMFLAPFAFYLLAKRLAWLMILVSFGFWAVGQHVDVDNFTITWQFLFNGAMLIGFYWQQLTDRWLALGNLARNKIKLAVNSVTAISFGLSYVSVFVLSVLNEKLASLPHWLNTFTLHWNSFNTWIWLYTQKWTLGPLRIVFFLFWFASLFMLVNRYAGSFNRRTRHLVELVGRNSLFVYIAHAFIVFIFKYFIPDQTNLGQNFLFTAAALVCLFGATIIYKTYELAIANRTRAVVGKLRWPVSKLLAAMS